MSVELPDLITPITPETAASSMAAGYRKVTGHLPSKKVLALLLAQWALETGNGSKVHNYNYGNKKASVTDEYHQFFRCWEVVNGKTVWYDPPHIACKFAAYRSPDTGAEAFVRLLKRRTHWWKGLHRETVAGFVDALATPPAYFTADPKKYENTMVNRVLAYMKLANQYGKKSDKFLQVLLGTGFSAVLLLVGAQLTNPLSSFHKWRVR